MNLQQRSKAERKNKLYVTLMQSVSLLITQLLRTFIDVFHQVMSLHQISGFKSIGKVFLVSEIGMLKKLLRVKYRSHLDSGHLQPRPE